MNELIQCPFCDSTKVGISSDDPQETTGYGKCFDCGARGPVASDTETITKQWNNRAQVKKLEKDIMTLERMQEPQSCLKILANAMSMFDNQRKGYEHFQKILEERIVQLNEHINVLEETIEGKDNEPKERT
jgi:Lar family restriction alleviation protein